MMERWGMLDWTDSVAMEDTKTRAASLPVILLLDPSLWQDILCLVIEASCEGPTPRMYTVPGLDQASSWIDWIARYPAFG